VVPKKTLKEVNDLILIFVKLSLSNEQNFPSTFGKVGSAFEITVGTAAKMSIALKNVAYRDIYNELEKAKCYNLKMMDGALISLHYRFQSGLIAEHILSFFPSPDLSHFQNEPEIYLYDEIYADVIGKNIVPFPVRFDFNSDTQKFVDVHHPKSHLTLGQYKNCRIPVCAPLGPFAFGGFLLRNFYNTAYNKYSSQLPKKSLQFGESITVNERKILHIAFSAK
jgi:hypothetical protein